MARALAQLLIDEGIVAPADVERALARQREVGGSLDTALLELGLIGEERLIPLLAHAARLPAAPATAYLQLDARARRVFPAKVAERHGLAPLALDGRELSLAAAYPVDVGLLDEISFMLSLQLTAHVGVEWRVRSLIHRLYGSPLSPRLARLAEGVGGPSAEPAAAPTPVAAAPPEPAAPRPPPMQAFGAEGGEQAEPLAAALAQAAEAFELDWEEDAAKASAAAPHPPPEPSHGGWAAPSLPAPTPPPIASAEPEPTAVAGPPEDRSAPPHWTLEQARQALADCTSRDEVVLVALRYARDFFDFAAAFAVARDAVVGHDALGAEDGLRDVCRTVAFYASEPGVFANALQSRAPYLGPVTADAPGNVALLDGLGREAPRTSLVYPVVVRDRAVCILYADNGGAPVSGRRLGDLFLLLSVVGAALERIIRARKAQPPAVRAKPQAVFFAPVSLDDRPAETGTWAASEPALRPAASPGEPAAAPQEATGEDWRDSHQLDAITELPADAATPMLSAEAPLRLGLLPGEGLLDAEDGLGLPEVSITEEEPVPATPAAAEAPLGQAAPASSEVHGLLQADVDARPAPTPAPATPPGGTDWSWPAPEPEAESASMVPAPAAAFEPSPAAEPAAEPALAGEVDFWPKPTAVLPVEPSPAEVPDVELPVAEQPTVEQPAVEQPAAPQPVAGWTVAEQTVAAEPMEIQPADIQPAAEQPDAPQAAELQPAVEQPAAPQPAEVEPAAEQPAAPQTAELQPADSQSAAPETFLGEPVPSVDSMFAAPVLGEPPFLPTPEPRPPAPPPAGALAELAAEPVAEPASAPLPVAPFPLEPSAERLAADDGLLPDPSVSITVELPSRFSPSDWAPIAETFAEPPTEPEIPPIEPVATAAAEPAPEQPPEEPFAPEPSLWPGASLTDEPPAPVSPLLAALQDPLPVETTPAEPLPITPPLVAPPLEAPVAQEEAEASAAEADRTVAAAAAAAAAVLGGATAGSAAAVLPPDEVAPPPASGPTAHPEPAAFAPDITLEKPLAKPGEGPRGAAGLVEDYLASPRGSEERAALLALLAQRADETGPILTARLPGPLDVEPEALARTPVAQQGPVLAAVAALGAAATAPLLRMLSDAAPDRRRAAAALLGLTGDPAALAPLAERCLDTHGPVAEAARQALAPHRLEAALRPPLEKLRRALLSGLADKSAAAARAIGALRDAESIPLLIQALEGSDAVTAGATADALAAITMQRLGPSPRAWLLWWKQNRGKPRRDWLFGALTAAERELRVQAAAELREAAPSPVNYSADLPVDERQEAARAWAAWFERNGYRA